MTTRPLIVWLRDDDRVGLPPRSRCRAKNTRLEIGDAVVAGAEFDPRGANAGRFDLVGQLGEHPVAKRLFACVRDPGRYPGLPVIARRNDDRKRGRLGDGAVDVGSSSNATGGTLDQCRDAKRLDALDFGRHHADDVGRVGLGVAWLIGRPQINENVLMRQDHAELVAGPWTKGRVQFRQGSNSSVEDWCARRESAGIPLEHCR